MDSTFRSFGPAGFASVIPADSAGTLHTEMPISPAWLESRNSWAIPAGFVFQTCGQGAVAVNAILLRRREGEGNRENPTPLPHYSERIASGGQHVPKKL